MSQKEELLDILKQLYTVSGFRMTLLDSNYQTICSYPEQTDFCKLLHKNPKACDICLQYDHIGFKEAEKLGGLYVYQCHFGLYEAISPLYYCGKLTGYLMMGQTLSNSKFDREYTYQISEPFVEDKAYLKVTIDQLTMHTKEKLAACAAIMEICASYITFTHQVESPSPDFPLAIKEYIHYFYYRPIQLDDLCDHFSCSKATITNAFKHAYGISVRQYLIDYRLKQAQILLKDVEMPIKEIASQCGFTDQNYFTKVFTRAFQVSPTIYRQQLKKNTQLP